MNIKRLNSIVRYYIGRIKALVGNYEWEPEDLRYEARYIEFLEKVWGKGFMSGGGVAEVGNLIENIPIKGKAVLDFGSGAGGVAVSLVRDFGAASVTGIDIEPPVCVRAKELIAEEELENQIDIRLVKPGRLPLDDASMDVIVCKDSILHVPDKVTLLHDLFRVLRTDSWVAISEWVIGHEEKPSRELTRFLTNEGVLSTPLFSTGRFKKALEEAGFVDIRFVDTNESDIEHALQEIERMKNTERAEFIAMSSAENVNQNIESWASSIPVLESRELLSCNIQARKP